MSRLLSDADFKSLVKSSDIKTNREVKQIESKVYLLTHDRDTPDLRGFLSTLNLDAVLVQGTYGSNLFNIRDQIMESSIEQSFLQFSPIDITSSILERAVLKDSTFFSEINPTLKGLALNIAEVSNRMDYSYLHVEPSISSATREWFQRLTPLRRRTVFIPLSSVYTCVKREEKDPKFRETTNALTYHLQTAISKLTFPSTRDGWENIIFVVDNSVGPLYFGETEVGFNLFNKHYRSNKIEAVSV